MPPAPLGRHTPLTALHSGGPRDSCRGGPLISISDSADIRRLARSAHAAELYAGRSERRCNQLLKPPLYLVRCYDTRSEIRANRAHAGLACEMVAPRERGGET